MKRITILALTALTAACGARAPDHPGDAEWLHSALGQLTDVIVYDIFSPPQASRTYAYASIAAYEALRHDQPDYRTLAGQLNGLAPVPAPDPGVEYHLPLAGIHAFHTVGKALTFSPARMDSLRSEMQRHIRREARLTRAVHDRSIAYGDAVARHILAWAAEDRFLERLGYPKFTVVSEPGRWVPTPPGYMDAVEPNWTILRPFVMDSASQFRPRPPLDYDMSEGSPFFRQVVEVWEAGRDLSDDQHEIAHFWNDNPYTMNVQGHAMFATKMASPGGHWMNIAGIAARQVDADLISSAEAYAITAIALFEGFMSCWEEKYRSNLVRPETVINAYLDEDWVPLLQTPPFPEYTSGHSVISMAAAVVLTDQFGHGFAFDDTSGLDYGLPVRSFASFEEAAAEAAISRLYGGIHYAMAIEEGVRQGRQVGALVLERVRTREPAALANK